MNIKTNLPRWWSRTPVGVARAQPGWTPSEQVAVEDGIRTFDWTGYGFVGVAEADDAWIKDLAANVLIRMAGVRE